MRAVQITRFGGPEVLEIVDVPEPTPGPGQQLYEVEPTALRVVLTRRPGAPRQVATTARDAVVPRATNLGVRACPWC